MSKIYSEYENVIYAYFNTLKNKIVYIGQTINLKNRDDRHLKYNPFDENCKEYNYPLSRGIRKYGVENYKLIILENNLEQSELDKKEKYYIKLYDTYNDGYNQNTGGTHFTAYYKFDKDILGKIIYLLKDTDMSFVDICEITGTSFTHLFNINEGIRRKQDNLNYPIRKYDLRHGQKLESNTVNSIVEDLRNMRLKMSVIAKKYNCLETTISQINNGKYYYNSTLNYPIRDKRCYKKWEILLSDEDKDEIIYYLLNTHIKYEEIAQMYGVAKRVINYINTGEIFYDDSRSYPLRKSHKKISNEQINKAKELLTTSDLSYMAISKMCGMSDTYIRQMNQGFVYSNESEIYPLRA